MRFFNIFTFLLIANLAATERIDLARDEKSHLIGYYDVPEKENFPVVILLQGAQEESVRRLHDSLKDLFLPSGLGVASLQKQGIGEKSYRKYNKIQNRIDDHALFLSKKESIPGWNGKFFLIGQGEGGRVAASVAKSQDHLLGIILIASGGAWTPQAEALASFRNEMVKNGFHPQYIHSFLVQSKTQFENAMKHPSDEMDLFGFSYQYWESLMKVNLLENLSQLDSPIYYIHGDLDDRIPLESANALIENLKEKKNFISKRYPYGREIIQNRSVYEDLVQFLQK